MSIIVRRSEPSDAKGIKEIYECTNAYTGTLQLPNPSLESWQNEFLICLITCIPMSR